MQCRIVESEGTTVHLGVPGLVLRSPGAADAAVLDYCRRVTRAARFVTVGTFMPRMTAESSVSTYGFNVALPAVSYHGEYHSRPALPVVASSSYA